MGKSRARWLLVATVLLSGCGGPSNQTLCAAALAALPIIYVITALVLWALEWVRRAGDADDRAVLRQVAWSTALLVVVVAGALATSKRAEYAREYVPLAVLTLGSVHLAASLVLWRILRRRAYVTRVLRAAQWPALLALPALFVTVNLLPGLADAYIAAVLLGAMGGMALAPLLAVGLLVQAWMERRKRWP